MNVILRPAFRHAFLLSTMLLGCAVPLDAAENAPAAPATATAPAAMTDQHQAALDALDKALARYETLVNRDDDAKHQAADKVVLDGFKQRRTALGQAFDQGHYDDLRVDLNLEYQRLASWMATPTIPPLTPKPQHPSDPPPASATGRQ